MTWAFGEKVTVRRAGDPTQDGDGNDIIPFTESNIDGVAVYPSSSTEALDGRVLVVNEIHVVFQPAIDLSDQDEIKVLTGRYAETYPVLGIPKQYRSPMTGTDVTDAVIKRVTG